MRRRATISAETSLSGSGDGRDDPGSGVNATHTLIASVKDVNIAVPVRCRSVRLSQSRIGRLAAIARKSDQAVSRHRRNQSRRRNLANARPIEIGKMIIASAVEEERADRVGDIGQQSRDVFAVVAEGSGSDDSRQCARWHAVDDQHARAADIPRLVRSRHDDLVAPGQNRQSRNRPTRRPAGRSGQATIRTPSHRRDTQVVRRRANHVDRASSGIDRRRARCGDSDPRRLYVGLAFLRHGEAATGDGDRAKTAFEGSIGLDLHPDRAAR